MGTQQHLFLVFLFVCLLSQNHTLELCSRKIHLVTPMAHSAVFLLRTLAVMCRILVQTLHCTQATFTTAFDRKKLPHDWNSGKSLLNQTKTTPHPHYTGMVTHSCMFDFAWLCKKSTLYLPKIKEHWRRVAMSTNWCTVFFKSSYTFNYA